jgi:hypothetical protein
MPVENPYCPLKVAFKGKETRETRCTSWCAWSLGKFGCAILVIAQMITRDSVKQK